MANYLAESPTQVRMMGDRILLRPMAWRPSKILEVVRHGRPLRGEVLAIGPGTNPKKYKRGLKGPKSLMDYSRHFRPTEVRVGDVVELGGLNQFDGLGYQFTEVIVGAETCLVCQEADVVGIVERENAD